MVPFLRKPVPSQDHIIRSKKERLHERSGDKKESEGLIHAGSTVEESRGNKFQLPNLSIFRVETS